MSGGFLPSRPVSAAAFAVGAVLASAVAGTTIGWRFGFDPALGESWFRIAALPFYPPTAPWRWWAAWGHVEPYRAPFLAGRNLALLVGLLPFFAVQLHRLLKPMPVGDDPDRDDSGLGRARDLWKRRGWPWPFGEPSPIKRRGEAGVVIGRAGRFGPILRDAGDGHVLIMGATRSGKTVGHIVPTLLCHPGPVLVFDPKPELRAICGRQRARFGPVLHLNPLDPTAHRFNPLLELRQGEHLIGDCQRAAHMLAFAGAGEDASSGKDRIWDSQAAHLLATLLVHLIERGQPSLAALNTLLLQIMTGNYPTHASPWVAERLEAHAAQFDKIRDSVHFTARDRLAFLDDPLVAASCGASEFRAGDLMASAGPPISLFVSVDEANAGRLRPWTRLVLQALWSAWTADVASVADGRPKRRWPLLAVLDEFPQLGRLEFLEQGIATCAGKGLRAMLVCQDKAQIVRSYGPNQTITINCSTACVVPGLSDSTLKMVQDWAGEHTVAHGSRQLRFRGGLGPLTESETVRKVLNPRHLRRRAGEEVLVFAERCDPTWLRKLRYWKVRRWRGRFDSVFAAPSVSPPQENPPWSPPPSTAPFRTRPTLALPPSSPTPPTA